MASLSVEDRNYFKLVRLLDRSCVSLRLLFKNRYSQFNSGAIWDDLPTCGQGIFANMTANNKRKYRYVTALIENGDSNQWDLSILLSLLFEIDQPATLSSNDVQRLKEEDEQLEKLITIRNEIEHHPVKSIINAKFDQIWNDLSQILLTFGDVTITELDKLKDDNIFNPRDHPIDKENVEKAKQFNSEGTKEHKVKKYSEAIAQFTKAINLSGVADCNRAIFYSNRSLSRLNMYEQKLSISQEKGEVFTDPDGLQYNALLDAKKARDLSISSWKGHYRVGQAYASMSEHEKAIRSFESAFALSPANETIQKALNESWSIHYRQLRKEHLDPRVSPGSISQLFNEAEKLLGSDIPKLRFQLSLLEQFNPVAAAVFKGHQYRYGDEGIEQDFVQAVKYYTEAAEQGNAEGIYNLAYLTDRGLGIKKDLVQAHKLYEQAAAQRSEPSEYGRRRNVGVAESEYELGLRHAEGIVVHKSLPIAAMWYQRAVDHESDAAANKLAEMYETGTGVIQNHNKAEELYEIAARRGDPDAMYSLSELALGKGDLDMALLWHKRTIEAGNITAQTNHSKFMLIHQGRRQFRDKYPLAFSKLINTKNNLLDSLKIYESVCTKSDSTSTCQYDIDELSQYAERGSETAKQMCSALEHFYLAMYLILSNEDKDLAENQENEVVHELSQCYRTEHIVAQYSNEKIRKQCHDIVDRVLRRCNSKGKILNSKLDEDARICYAQLNLDRRDLICPFLDQCIAKYPKSIIFYDLKANLYGLRKEFDKAVYEANRGLEIDPNNSDLLFSKATALRLLERDMNEAIKAYELFIAKAPKDHRRMPDAYYEMCQCFESTNTRNITEKTYKQGQEAEKLQLPCFLPFESNARVLIEYYLDIKPERFTESTVSIKQKDRLTNPHRIEVILEQRHWKAHYLKSIEESTIMKGSYSLPPRLRQKTARSLVGLKSISIREMDPRKDHIYEGYVLSVKIIEDALDWKPSIHLIVEDESYNCERLYIYNCTQDEGEYLIKQVYTLGRQMQVINPYLRIGTYDAKPTIRIDDLSSIVMEDQAEKTALNVCQCCGESNALHVCSICRQTRYCSKECQTIDWKTYRHGLICQKS